MKIEPLTRAGFAPFGDVIEFDGAQQPCNYLGYQRRHKPADYKNDHKAEYFRQCSKQGGHGGGKRAHHCAAKAFDLVHM